MYKLDRFCISTLIFSALALSGCATMDRDECQTANWEIIGLEDGAVGRGGSYIGKHRSACAEYGVSPDLERYMAGHKKGLQQYCSFQSGFNLGNRGKGFTNVCVDTNAAAFSKGYKQGKKQHDLRAELSQLKSEIEHYHRRVHQIERQLAINEESIISDQTTAEERKRLLDDNRALRAEIEEIQYLLAELTAKLQPLEKRYQDYIKSKR